MGFDEQVGEGGISSRFLWLRPGDGGKERVGADRCELRSNFDGPQYLRIIVSFWTASVFLLL